MSDRTKNKTSRHLAILCLARWARTRQPVQPHIDAFIHNSLLSPTDRHLGVMLVQGVLRQMQYLDFIIGRFAKHPLAKMKPLMLMALRVGVYQLLFLERIPDSAAVNETVKVLKAEKQPRWIVNFANGVLRNISRKQKEFPGVDKAGEGGTAVLNHPSWIIQRWQEIYGLEKTMEICRINNQEPFLVLRVNSLVSDPESLANQFRELGIEVQGGRYTPGSLIIKSPAGPVSCLPGYNEGYFHVQDEAAQLVTFLLGPFHAGERYLDACAGLGGKTIMLAQMMPEDTELFAVEPSEHRFQLLQENINRVGLTKKIIAIPGKLSELIESNPGKFRGILVDAPCSGTGVIRRHPDIRWNRRLKDLLAYQHQQLEILQQAASLLKPGGVLVYATCSMEPEENEQVAEKFLATNPEFVITDAAEFLPASTTNLISPEGFFSSIPAEGLDGFFAMRLERAPEETVSGIVS